MRATIKLILALAIIILVVSFVLQNPWINDTHQIHFAGYKSIPINLSFIILGALLSGAIIVSGSMLVSQLKLKKKIRSQQKRLGQLEEELHSLRNLPLMETELNKKQISESTAAAPQKV